MIEYVCACNIKSSTHSETHLAHHATRLSDGWESAQSWCLPNIKTNQRHRLELSLHHKIYSISLTLSLFLRELNTDLNAIITILPFLSLGAEEPLTRDEVPGPGNILDKILPSPPLCAPGQRSLT
jgi:hypothetical protein